MNIKKTLNKRRNIVQSVLSVLLIAAVAYGILSWIQGRKQY